MCGRRFWAVCVALVALAAPHLWRRRLTLDDRYPADPVTGARSLWYYGYVPPPTMRYKRVRRERVWLTGARQPEARPAS